LSLPTGRNLTPRESDRAIAARTRRHAPRRRSRGVDLIEAWRARIPALAVDLAIAAGVVVVGLSQTAPIFERRPGDSEGWPLALLAGGALLFRTTSPLLALGGATFAASWFLFLGNHAALAVLPAVLVAQYTVVARAEPSRRASIALALAAAGLLAVAAQLGGPRRPASGWAMDAGWITAAILLGDTMRNRRELAAQAEARAEQAEPTRDEEARRRVTEERLAIARELHDVVAHTIALINVQAGVAAHVFDTNPDQARQAFEHIRTATTGRSTSSAPWSACSVRPATVPSRSSPPAASTPSTRSSPASARPAWT
jgi:hypothetical protein